MAFDTWKQPVEPFEVTESLLTKIREDPFTVEDIDGYHGHPITGVGDVYTPPELVEFVLDQVGYVESNPIERMRVADLSCGTGSFVVEIIRRLRSRLISLGYQPDDPDGARHIISTIKNNVVALDIESKAVWRTAQLVLQELQQEIRSVPEINPVATLPIFHTDTLRPNLELDDNLFHRIVGNPPYIKNKDIAEEDDEIYRREYKTATGKYDIYPLFFEKGLKLLVPGGKIGLITPDRFHRTKYGRPLRTLLVSETRIELILNLKDDPFPVVNAYPSITVAEKQDTGFPNYQYDNRFVYCEMTTEELAAKSNELITENADLAACSEYAQSELDNRSWKFIPPQILTLKNDLESSLTKLSELRIDLRAGVATGADDIFILSEKDAKRMESELIYPIIRGKDIRKGQLTDNQFILNPYTSKGKTIELDGFPEAKGYLTHFKNKLEQRYCVRESGKKWFETHDTINLKKELKERIVTPDVSAEARFAISSDKICHNSCYSIYYDGDLKVLAAILNSSICEFFLRATLPKLDDGYWRQMKRDMMSLPIVNPYVLDDTETRVLKDAYGDRDWGKIDSVIFDLLDVSEPEEELIFEYLN